MAEAALPEEIAACLNGHHVVSLAVRDGDGLWAASCFYAADLATASLVFLSASTTRHGAALIARSEVAGTIAGQPDTIAAIEGIQFTGRAERLAGAAREAGLALYLARHPAARLAVSDVWQLRLDTIKHTANRVAFGRKTHWRRGADGVGLPHS